MAHDNACDVDAAQAMLPQAQQRNLSCRRGSPPEPPAYDCTPSSVTPSNFLASKLISLYSRAEPIDDARKVFDVVPRPSLFAWNAILIALSLHSPDPSAAVRLFAAYGVSPDDITLSALLKSIVVSGPALSPLVSGELHTSALLRGFGTNLFVSNGLITAYANAGVIHSARTMFDEMPYQDIVSRNSLISSYACAGCYRECLDLFQKLTLVPVYGGVTEQHHSE
jgi:pentatricopeptide repeat protein